VAMAKSQKTEKFEGEKPENVFEAGKKVFDEIGMEIIKVRSFAFFLQAQTKGGGDMIDASFIVSGFQNEFSLTLTSETAGQEKLETFADEYLEKLDHHLSDDCNKAIF
jgi:hypothetical protein